MQIPRLGMGDPNPRKLGKAPHPSEQGGDRGMGRWGGMGGRDRSGGVFDTKIYGYMRDAACQDTPFRAFLSGFALGRANIISCVCFVSVFRNQQRALMVMTSNAH